MTTESTQGLSLDQCDIVGREESAGSLRAPQTGGNDSSFVHGKTAPQLSLSPVVEQYLAGLYDLETCRTAPTRAELASAPVVRNWSIIDMGRRGYRLAGITNEAPKTPLEEILTSAIVEINFQNNWARTVNSLYRLAEPKAMPNK